MAQVNLGIKGQPNVTITMFNDGVDQDMIAHKWADRNPDDVQFFCARDRLEADMGKGNMPVVFPKGKAV